MFKLKVVLHNNASYQTITDTFLDNKNSIIYNCTYIFHVDIQITNRIYLDLNNSIDYFGTGIGTL